MTLRAPPVDHRLEAAYNELSNELVGRIRRIVNTRFKDLGDDRAWSEDAAGYAWVETLARYGDQLARTADLIASSAATDDDERDRERQKCLALMTFIAHNWLIKSLKHKATDLDEIVTVIADSSAEDLVRRLDRERAIRVLHRFLAELDELAQAQMLDLLDDQDQDDVATKWKTPRGTLASAKKRFLDRMRAFFAGSRREANGVVR